MKIGVDLGGTKIECVVIDDNNHILFRERRPTPQDDYQGIIKTIKELVDLTLPHTQHSQNPPPVGVGIPGTLSGDTGTVKNANTTCLIGKQLDRDLSQALNRPVRLANDANCFIWSEFCDGAAKGYSNAFGVIIGTGVGGGLVINNCLVNGLNGIAGEWGHNPLPRFDLEETQCYCGKTDCIETYLSGPGFTKRYQKIHNELCLPDNTPITAKDVVQLAEQGNYMAARHLNQYAKMLAASLTSVINIVDPDIIVLGGGMSNIELLYERVPKYLKEYVFSDNIHTKVVKAKHGDSSGVRGAAWLWRD